MGQPFWYVDGVKLTLCAVSLTIPASMYVFARRHFGEHTARMALVAGALWYELAGFAHKPMAEFLATAPLMGLLALAVRPSVDDRVWWAPILAVLTAALRMQYAPLALAVMGVVLLRSRRRLPIALVALGGVLAVGISDAILSKKPGPPHIHVRAPHGTLPRAPRGALCYRGYGVLHVGSPQPPNWRHGKRTRGYAWA